jgi:radical SAM superfamily enzyme YgiQ (UPF0313 family)
MSETKTKNLRDNILLVDPLLRTKYNGLLDDFNKKYDIPYGLLAIGSYLKTKGIESKIISMDYETDSRNQSDQDVLKQYLVENNPKVVGFTSYTLQYEDTKRLANVVNVFNPDIRVIIGGHHAMHQPEKVLETGLFDAVVLGEGEKTLEEFVSRLYSNEPIEDVKGIAYLNNDEIIINKTKERLEGGEISIPDYSLLPKELVKNANIEIMTSRGCPYDCSFCSSPAQYGRKVKTRSLDSVKSEIENIVRDYGHERIGILDETLHARKDFKELMQTLKEVHNNFGVEYLSQTRADLVVKNPSSLRLMKDTGIVSLIIGAESASDIVLKEMNKQSSYENVPKALELIKSAGIKPGTFWIIGHPGSSYKEEMKTKQAIEELLKKDLSDYTEANLFIPYLGAKASKDPRITKIDSDLSKFNRTSEPVFDLEEFSKEEIKQAYIDIIRVIKRYKRNN